MNNAEMEAELRAAMDPYLRCFLRKREAAKLTIAVTKTKAKAVLTVASTDFRRIRGKVTLRSHFSRCFNELCRHLDKKRTPSLDYEKASTPRGRKKAQKRAQKRSLSTRRKTKKKKTTQRRSKRKKTQRRRKRRTTTKKKRRS